MRILGIDPGSRVTGWGLLDAASGDARMLCHGAIRTGDGELPARLCRLADALAALVRDHAPHAAAVEAVFSAAHARSALVLGHARGVVLLTIAQAGVPLFEYPPARVKSAVTGSGRADKEQVARALATQLCLRDVPHPVDASDALAVALCHVAASRMATTLERSGLDAGEIAAALRPGASQRRSRWMRRRLG